MILHENPEIFKDAITATAQRLNIPEIYIEKDYWVTLALKAIFTSDFNDAVFKGGTALSKCYKIIQRFSEDIDLVVLRNGGENDTQLKKKIKAITGLVSTVIPEVEIDGITHKMGMIRKTAHAYKKENFAGEYGQIRENIIVEATWLGNSEPYTNAEVNCFIAEMMIDNDQEDLVEQFQLKSFSVKVLTLERTLCEKIMSLVRFSHTQHPLEDLANKIRHIYDIHLMLNNTQVANFFNSIEFDKMLVIVGSDDIQSFKNNNEWLKIHPQDAIIFSEPEKTWDAIKQPYRTSFRDLVTGKLPLEQDLIETLIEISKRLNKLEWSLNKSK